MGVLQWGREKLGWGPAGPAVAIPDLRFTVLDTELTGLDERRDDIVSIGALHMQGARIELGNAFQELVNPKAVLDGRTVVIHGITPSQLEAMPSIEGVLAGFMGLSSLASLGRGSLALSQDQSAFFLKSRQAVTAGQEYDLGAPPVLMLGDGLLLEVRDI